MFVLPSSANLCPVSTFISFTIIMRFIYTAQLGSADVCSHPKMCIEQTKRVIYSLVYVPYLPTQLRANFYYLA